MVAREERNVCCVLVMVLVGDLLLVLGLKIWITLIRLLYLHLDQRISGMSNMISQRPEEWTMNVSCWDL